MVIQENVMQNALGVIKIRKIQNIGHPHVR